MTCCLPLGPPLTDDLLAYGAAAMQSEDLIELLLGGRAPTDEVMRAADALRLSPRARLEALRALEHGPLLLAALELGRRALLANLPGSPVMRGPSDLVALALPRLAEREDGLLGFALDSRLAVARVYDVPSTEPGVASAADVLGPALAAGARHVAFAELRPDGTARDDEAHAQAVLMRLDLAEALGLYLLDHVLLEEEGYVSLLRRGRLPPRDRRYR